MPHLIIEYPAQITTATQVETMLAAVYRAAAGSGLFDEAHIRVRAWPLEHYQLGGERRAFMHAQCRIHAGRAVAQKKALSEAVLAALHELAWAVEVITVEVVELEQASYAKWVAAGE